MQKITNPFKPGAGHQPPYLAGREKEVADFKVIIEQETILDNMVLTGLRGVGKTVLLENLKPLAQQAGWFWVGTDMSESASLSENTISTRLLADLSVITSSFIVAQETVKAMGFTEELETINKTLDFNTLSKIYSSTPGLASDKLKAILELVWKEIKDKDNVRGIVFAYDEAQTLSDHSDKDEFPLSLLLDVFQSIQKKGVPFLLLLTGLPTLFPKLVEARTYAERMFQVVFLDKLNKKDAKAAITVPTKGSGIIFTPESVDLIIETSGGYPYFIQFMCREIYDIFLQKIGNDTSISVKMESIIIKLDTDFFSGRWAKSTDRQRQLLSLIANLKNYNQEWSVQDIVEESNNVSRKRFSNSHVNQMLVALCKGGLVYKNRYGKYSFAVPLLGDFIKRQDMDFG